MTGREITNYDERFAAMAAQYAEMERGGGDFVSFKSGIITVGGEEMPGNQICVVILDAVVERTFYNTKYSEDAERNNPPICYAFARSKAEEAEMGPHPSMESDLSYFQPQNDTCAGCPNDEYNTADTGGGKACGERRRMAIIPAGFYEKKRGSKELELELIEDYDHYAKADIAYAKIPTMSLKFWAKYVQYLKATYNLPPLGVVTRIFTEPDKKATFTVRFEVVEVIPKDLFPTVWARYEEASSNIIFPYTAPSLAERVGGGNGAGGAGRTARR